MKTYFCEKHGGLSTVALAAKQLCNRLIVIIGGIHMIFPFSRNGPANYKFSLFSKLPTNYPKISEKIPKTYVKIPRSGIFRCVNCIFFEIFG